MGSVLYLPRGLQRKEVSLTAATTRPESILRPGYNACAVARAERVALLVDAEAYFRAFYQAALRAKRSITRSCRSSTIIILECTSRQQPSARPGMWG